jgi:hypothetical protein
MRFVAHLVIVVSIIAAITCGSHATAQSASSATKAPRSAALPGKQTDGSVLLPNQWSLRPTGRQVELGDFPINVAVHPSGRFVVALHAGWGAHAT